VPYWVKKLPIAMGAFGLLLGWIAYNRIPAIPAIAVKIFKPLHKLFFNKWFFDELYHKLFVAPALWFGRVFWGTDKHVVDGLGPDGVAKTSYGIGGLFSRLQTGYVFQYAFVMMLGLIALISWFFFKTDLGVSDVTIDINGEGVE